MASKGAAKQQNQQKQSGKSAQSRHLRPSHRHYTENHRFFEASILPKDILGDGIALLRSFIGAATALLLLLVGAAVYRQLALPR